MEIAHKDSSPLLRRLTPADLYAARVAMLTLLHNLGLDTLQSFGDSTGEFTL